MNNLWIISHPNRPTFILNGNIQGVLNALGAVNIGNDVMGFEPNTDEASWTFAIKMDNYDVDVMIGRTGK